MSQNKIASACMAFIVSLAIGYTALIAVAILPQIIELIIDNWARLLKHGSDGV